MDRKSFWLASAGLAWCVLLLATPQLPAAALVSPTAVLETDLGEFSPQTAVGNMINQSGLDKPFNSGVTDFDTYFTTGAQPFGQANFVNNWQSEVSFTLPVTGHVDFDFGEVWSIDRLAIWNISLKDVVILTSETSPSSFTEVTSFTLSNHIHFPFSYNPEILDLGGAVNARYLRIQIDSVYLFDLSDTFGYAIVGELTASAAPPSAGLAGDFNTSDIVDAADYTLWRDNLGSNFALGGNGDEAGASSGIVDQADYILWKANFGDAAGSGSLMGGAVPEPATWLLLLAAAICRLATRQRPLR